MGEVRRPTPTKSGSQENRRPARAAGAWADGIAAARTAGDPDGRRPGRPAARTAGGADGRGLLDETRGGLRAELAGDVPAAPAGAR